MIYNGPINDAEAFFIATGFRCPPRTDMPDFLQEVTSRKDQVIFGESQAAHEAVLEWQAGCLHAVSSSCDA